MQKDIKRTILSLIQLRNNIFKVESIASSYLIHCLYTTLS